MLKGKGVCYSLPAQVTNVLLTLMYNLMQRAHYDDDDFFFQRTWLSTVYFATPVPCCWIMPFAVSITAQITAVSRFLERSVSSIEQRNRRKSALNRRKSSHLTLLHKAIHGESALEIPC